MRAIHLLPYEGGRSRLPPASSSEGMSPSAGKPSPHRAARAFASLRPSRWKGEGGCGLVPLLLRLDDLRQVIRRALDPLQVRVLQAAVVIDRHRAVFVLVLQQQLDRRVAALGG